jgi:hypothetical protein
MSTTLLTSSSSAAMELRDVAGGSGIWMSVSPMRIHTAGLERACTDMFSFSKRRQTTQRLTSTLGLKG